MKERKIIETFNTLYNELEEEFNNGLITVVGSTLNHITGFKEKEDDTGDIDLLVNTEAGELALIKAARYLGTDVKVIYEPNMNYRGLKIWFDEDKGLVEIFRIDPKKGVYGDIVYKGKTYSMYIERMEDQLDELFNILLVTVNKLTSALEQAETNKSDKLERITTGLKWKVEKHLNTIHYHIDRAEFDITELCNYWSYVESKQRFEALELP